MTKTLYAAIGLVSVLLLTFLPGCESTTALKVDTFSAPHEDACRIVVTRERKFPGWIMAFRVIDKGDVYAGTGIAPKGSFAYEAGRAPMYPNASLNGVAGESQFTTAQRALEASTYTSVEGLETGTEIGILGNGGEVSWYRKAGTYQPLAMIVGGTNARIWGTPMRLKPGFEYHFKFGVDLVWVFVDERPLR